MTSSIFTSVHKYYSITKLKISQKKIIINLLTGSKSVIRLTPEVNFPRTGSDDIRVQPGPESGREQQLTGSDVIELDRKLIPKKKWHWRLIGAVDT
jgi:hypothetical protein